MPNTVLRKTPEKKSAGTEAAQEGDSRHTETDGLVSGEEDERNVFAETSSVTESRKTASPGKYENNQTTPGNSKIRNWAFLFIFLTASAVLFSSLSKHRAMKSPVASTATIMDVNFESQAVETPIATEAQAVLDHGAELVQEALSLQEQELKRYDEQQSRLEDTLKQQLAKPPPPPAAPPPPMLTRKEWEAKVVEEARLKAIAKRNAEKQRQISQYWKQGDWYWGPSRSFRKAQSKPKKGDKPQCFRDAQHRRADFWAPIPTQFHKGKAHLPIFDVAHPGSPKATCFTGHKPSGKKGFVVSTCPAEQWNQLLKERWVGTQCTLRPLHEEMLFYLLRSHRVWFFGDYNMKTVFKTLQCTMAKYGKKHGVLPPGSITGVRPEYQQIGFQGETELFYVYVGPYRQDEHQAEAKVAPRDGLGSEIRSKYGLDATLNLDSHADDHVRLHELADAIQESLGYFQASDIMVVNIGNDHREPRSLQTSLLKFLRVYEDNKENLPVVVWQESTAQHHSGFKGGDRFGQHQAERPEDPTGLFGERITCGSVPQQEMRDGNWRNQMSNRLVEAAGIPILRVWQVYRSSLAQGRSLAVGSPLDDAVVSPIDERRPLSPTSRPAESHQHPPFLCWFSGHAPWRRRPHPTHQSPSRPFIQRERGGICAVEVLGGPDLPIADSHRGSLCRQFLPAIRSAGVVRCLRRRRSFTTSTRRDARRPSALSRRRAATIATRGRCRSSSPRCS
uniref:Transmembrane protein n=1 Tax=Tetraselmis sp. GSL018 TaxID=582737 RepID=A0A061R3K2_9CHLO